MKKRALKQALGSTKGSKSKSSKKGEKKKMTKASLYPLRITKRNFSFFCEMQVEVEPSVSFPRSREGVVIWFVKLNWRLSGLWSGLVPEKS